MWAVRGVASGLLSPEPLAEIGARPSIGSIGDSYDNSLAESVDGLYKTELIRRQKIFDGLLERLDEQPS